MPAITICVTQFLINSKKLPNYLDVEIGLRACASPNYVIRIEKLF